MSKSEVKPREFYFEYMEEANEYQQLSCKAPYVKDSSFELVHVIEYSAYQALQKENEELKEEIAKLKYEVTVADYEK